MFEYLSLNPLYCWSALTVAFLYLMVVNIIKFMNLKALASHAARGAVHEFVRERPEGEDVKAQTARVVLGGARAASSHLGRTFLLILMWALLAFICLVVALISFIAR